MPNGFDRDLIEYLRGVEEVEIETRSSADKPSRRRIIWIVVVDGDVFVRSVRGVAGRWYRDLQSFPSAILHAGARNEAVRPIPVADAATIERVSAEFLRKYATSPHAPPMVREEVLGTTIRLEPA